MSQIERNTTALQELLEAVNEFPNAPKDNMFYATITIASQSNNITISHSLGRVPSRYWITFDANSANIGRYTTGVSPTVILSLSGDNNGKSFALRVGTSGTEGYQTNTSYAIGGGSVTADEETFSVTYGDPNSTSDTFRVGATYSVILMAD